MRRINRAEVKKVQPFQSAPRRSDDPHNSQRVGDFIVHRVANFDGHEIHRSTCVLSGISNMTAARCMPRAFDASLAEANRAQLHRGITPACEATDRPAPYDLWLAKIHQQYRKAESAEIRIVHVRDSQPTLDAYF